MATLILATKLYIPPPRSKAVLRPRLIERLNEGLDGKLTLISAPAGFGKTTLVSKWIAGCNRPTAWLSLDAGDNDPSRFLTYLIAALQTIAPTVGESVLSILQSPQPPAIESILTALLNDIAAIKENFILVFDDYHVIDAKSVDKTLTFLLDHLPPQMHMVIVSREDPTLPIARLRARGQLNELRVADLRFTPSEAGGFLNQVMGLTLSAEDIDALETRTEGWIAGLQLAAISMQGHQAPTHFIKSFTGSHHFVLDYLVEEVLQRQPEHIQTFLLRTSILDRMCGPLCDAVMGTLDTSGKESLAALERANLFIVPLDNERRWYRYHHLFADLLRQRLHQTTSTDDSKNTDEYHKRASIWYEDNGLDIEAFHHATAAHDIERAERLIEGRGIPLHFRGAVTMILDWLHSLPTAVLNSRPSLWWSYASLLLVNGQTIGVDEKLDAAEAALQHAPIDDKARNLIGQIAAARATLALTRYQLDILIAQSHRALEYLPLSNLPYRATAHWALGLAYLYQGERIASRQAFTESIALSQAGGDVFTTILSTIGLGQVQEADNQLSVAAETYQHVLQWAGDQPLQIIYEAHLGLARILYEWNDLNASEQHVQQSVQLARQYDKVIDRFVVCELFLARLKQAQGDIASAEALLAQLEQSARQYNYLPRMPEIAAAQVLMLLHQGHIAAAAQLAQTYELPLSQARVFLAQGDPSAALQLLEPLYQQTEAKGWVDEQLKVMILQALAHDAHGEKDRAVQRLTDALRMAEPAGFIRLFVDEGPLMAQLLSEVLNRKLMSSYVGKLLKAFEAEKNTQAEQSSVGAVPALQPLFEPLSQRELEVLQLIAQGLSNHEIGEKLFLALDTVKGHNRRIYDKLQVQRRTEAVARARELGLL